MKVIAKYKSPSQFDISCPKCGKVANFFIKGYGELVLNPDVDEFDTFHIVEDGVGIGMLTPQFVCTQCDLMETIVISNYKDM